MAASLVTIWSNLVTAVKGINGSGVYTHDLSGSGAVQRVRVGQPMTGPPFATVVFDTGPSSHDVQLGSYRRDLQFTVVGWGLTTADTDDARTEAAANMLDDLLRAIESDRTQGGLVYDTLCHTAAFVASDAESGAQYPVAVVRVELYQRVLTGA
tara:strand:- start:3486 stop:3947 length:462 start_codon:yes stop_codon:yes gene_type:complete